MRFKRLLALLLAAALALSLLVGCGGGRNQSLSQMLLNLLDGQYQNVSVEIDSDLETKLRQAISQSETDEELRAALEQLLGDGISFQRLGSGQQGDSAWTLIIYPGTDPDAAARSVYLDLDKVFAALPADGVYSSGFAMAEMENGYAILVRATVDKAGTEDKPDPVTLESIKVTKEPDREYWAGQPFNPDGMEITATYSNGTTKTLKDIKQNGDQGVKWTPDGALTTVGTQDITITYGDQTTTVKVEVKEPGVEKIEVSGCKITYTEGESFDPNGMKVTVIYTGNIPAKTITGITHNGDKGVTWTPADGLTTEIDFVKVTYTDPDPEKGFASANVSVTVQAKPVTLESITVSGTYKTKYISGESFDPAGMTITATYSDDHTEPVENEDCTYSPETLSNDTTEVTISYGGKSTTVEVTVLDTEDSYQNGTYFIATAEGLQAWNQAALNDLSINCTLTANINLTDKEWTPIGTDDNNSYTGTFDGNGHTITGLTVNQEGTKYVGLIGFIGSDGTVKNVKLENVNITGSFYVGGVVGYNFGGTVIACTSSGSVSGSTYVGGVVGDNYGTVTACTASGSVKGSSNVGGVVGYNSRGSVTACTSSGSVEGSVDVGGVVGDNYGTVTACYWSGSPNAGIGGGKQKDAAEYNGTDHNNKVGSDWTEAVKAMNAALDSAGSKWRYELTGALPTLKKQ